MCTALSYHMKEHYFGRNLDMDTSYGETICIMPRRFCFPIRKGIPLKTHFAMIGMATIADGIPLFYEAANEYGLCMAGLNFPRNAWYASETEGYDNIAPYELIPWILGQCRTVVQARQMLQKINLIYLPFNEALPLASLHWMISDEKESIVLEGMRTGFNIYDNPIGVLTNNPPFDYQLFHLNNFRGLKSWSGENHFTKSFDLDLYCEGLGGIGLPGDVSSMSRFVRMVFNSQNSVCEPDEMSSVSQFFHLMHSVEMLRGGCRTENGTWDVTIYTCCINAKKGRYYYTTYDNPQISCVDLHKENLDGEELSVFDLQKKLQINCQN